MLIGNDFVKNRKYLFLTTTFFAEKLKRSFWPKVFGFWDVDFQVFKVTDTKDHG
jgi:hypothetical protein